MGIIICLPIFRWQYTEILQKLFSKVTDIVESTVVSRFTYLIPLQDEFRRFFNRILLMSSLADMPVIP